MTQTLSTTLTIELTLTLTGTFLKGYPETGPTYDSGGEPGQPDMIEDLEITAISYWNGKEDVPILLGPTFPQALTDAVAEEASTELLYIVQGDD